MHSSTTAEHIEILTNEYRELVAELNDREDLSKLGEVLMCKSEWTERGAAVLLSLAREYGTFVLSNALALAEALEIEDGEAGI